MKIIRQTSPQPKDRVVDAHSGPDPFRPGGHHDEMGPGGDPTADRAKQRAESDRVNKGRAQ
jgi:hypothetical protein